MGGFAGLTCDHWLERWVARAIDVVMTLSGIFRDLLPLQTKLLADAALQCAQADEPLDLNPIRAARVGVRYRK